MTGREKMEAAFSRDGASEIPAVICYEGIHYRDHWEAITSHPWWYARSPEVEKQLAWRRDAIEKTPQDWYSLPAASSRADRENVTIEDRGDGVYLLDRRTGSQDKLPVPQIGGWGVSCGVRSVRPERIAETREEIDEKLPLPEKFDERAFKSSGCTDLADRMLEEHKDLTPLAHVPGPLWSTYNLWGFENMMLMIASRPELVQYAAERILEGVLVQVRRAAALGVEVIWIEDCMTDLIGPAAYADLNAPVLRRITAEVRDCGMKSVYYYCGDPGGKWESLLSLGADGLSLEEGKKGWNIDIDDVVDRVAGSAVVFGNLDAIGLLPGASEVELAAEIERQIAAGRRNGGRFVMSIGSPVTPGTSVERVRLYCDLAHEIGSR